LLDVAVAVFARAVGGDVVTVDDVAAAIVRDPGEGGNVGGVWDGVRGPAAGGGGGDAGEMLVRDTGVMQAA